MDLVLETFSYNSVDNLNQLMIGTGDYIISNCQSYLSSTYHNFVNINPNDDLVDELEEEVEWIKAIENKVSDFLKQPFENMIAMDQKRNTNVDQLVINQPMSDSEWIE